MAILALVGDFLPTTSRRISNYATARARWKLNEAASPFLSSTGTAGNMVATGAPTAFSRGPLQRGIVFPGVQQNYVAAPANALRPGSSTNALTISAWIIPKTFQASHIFGKKYKNDNTWTSPLVSWVLSFTASGFPEFQLTTGTAGAGTRTVLTPTKGPAVLCVPSLVAGAWDGATMSVMLNGITIASTAKGNAIDYGGSGGDGAFYAGSGPSTNATTSVAFDGLIEECVCEDSAIGDSEMRDRYLLGMAMISGEAS